MAKWRTDSSSLSFSSVSDDDDRGSPRIVRTENRFDLSCSPSSSRKTPVQLFHRKSVTTNENPPGEDPDDLEADPHHAADESSVRTRIGERSSVIGVARDHFFVFFSRVYASRCCSRARDIGWVRIEETVNFA